MRCVVMYTGSVLAPMPQGSTGLKPEGLAVAHEGRESIEYMIEKTQMQASQDRVVVPPRIREEGVTG